MVSFVSGTSFFSAIYDKYYEKTPKNSVPCSEKMTVLKELTISVLAINPFESLYEIIQSGEWEPEKIKYKKYDLNVISDLLKSRIDKDKKACTDFYEYVCGNFDETVSDSGDVVKITRTNILSTIREILENKTIVRDDNFKLTMEKKFYASCMDTVVSRNEGKKLFMQMVNDNKGKSWQHVAEYYASKVGEISLFQIALNMENVLQIERPNMARSNIKEYKDLNHNLERSFMTQLFLLIKPTEDYSLAMEELKNFMKSVNELVYAPHSNLEKMNVQELQNFYDNNCPSNDAKIEWLRLFEKFAEGDRAYLKNSDPIQVDLNYILGLCNVLSKTPERVIVHYLHFNFLMDTGTFLYVSKIIDSFDDKRRSTACIDKIPINEGLNEEMVDYYIPHSNQETVNEMFQLLKQEWLIVLENSWLETDVKKVLMDRLNEVKIKFNIVHNSRMRSEVQELSYEFDVTSVALQNLISFKKAQILFKLLTYVRSLKKRRLQRDIGINAQYFQYSNVLHLNPGLMLPVFFHPEAPVAYNYGMLGFLIGHELSHALDFSRCEYCFTVIEAALSDQLQNPIYIKKRNCFEEQFNKFNVNGSITLDENVADTQGLKLSFKAMRQLIRENIVKKEEKLPGFEDLNADQLFFVSFANQWCSSSRSHIYNGNRHSPNPLRAIVTLMNMKEFSDAFNCMPEDRMNPIEKCDLWEKPNIKEETMN